MTDPRAANTRSEVFFMLISAGIFAYFGFGTGWAHQMSAPPPPATPQILPMVVLLKWSLRGGAIAFGVAALISLTGSLLGPVLYAAAGLVTAICFIAVAIWDWMHPQYISGVPAILLLVFAIWNGYGSWVGLSALAAARRTSSPGALPDADRPDRR